VVLVGDHHQLPEIDAGGAFRALVIRTDPIVLTENRRQREDWGRRMLELIRGGDVRRGLELASDAGAVHIAVTAEAAGAQLVGDWWQARAAGREAIMLAYRREEVRDLNAAGRALMDQAGRLGPQRLVLAGGEFAVGDEVLLRRRSMTAQVNNGSRGRIEAVDPDHEQVTLRLSDDRQVTLDADYLRQPGSNGQPSMVHGYAATIHTYQGTDTEATFAYGSPGLYRELVYTASSRHRQTLRFYLADPDVDRELAEFHGAHAEPQDAFERFVAQAERSHAQHTAIDRVHRQQAAALSPAELQREADRLERLAAHAPGPRLQRAAASSHKPKRSNATRR
jgi:ATP-dependent exoDNAse (exonuclease V) alpha subunit